MGKTNLIQFDKLKPGIPISAPEAIDPQTLQQLHRVAANICVQNNFSGLSINEIPRKHLIGYGLPEDVINGSIIFIRPNVFYPEEGMVTKDTLIINPEITEVSQETQPILNSCGSIGHGKLRYFVSQPEEVVLKGHTWTPSSNADLPAEKKELGYRVAFGETAFHEVRHNQGLSDLNFPNSILDFTQPAIMRDIKAQWDGMTESDFDEMMSCAGKMIIYRDKQILVTDSKGTIGDVFADYN